MLYFPVILFSFIEKQKRQIYTNLMNKIFSKVPPNKKINGEGRVAEWVEVLD